MEISEKLPGMVCSWYRENGRELPWRQTRDPYAIWVSEIMLQQTRVETVIPYYRRFLEALPKLRDLAECPEDHLLKLWEGLGYYSRVRHMQEAARRLVGRGEDRLPADVDALKALPGIGNYTAGAIASIAFGIPAAAVDGNVLRILSRLHADGRDILKTGFRSEAEQGLTDVMRSCTDPGAFCQGLMDIGAAVCLPNAMPRCEACPIRELCEAHRIGKQTDFPVRRRAKDRRVEARTVLVVRDGERIALHRRENQGLLAGMYEFPNVSGHIDAEQALHLIEDRGLCALHIEALEEARHLFSHVEWRMTGYEIRVASFPLPEDAEWILTEPGRIEKEYPIPSAFRAYAKRIDMMIGALQDKSKK